MRRKLFVICILFVTSIRADIINGDTDPLGMPRDLSINNIFAGYDSSQTTSIKNHILTHLSSDNLRTLAFSSCLYLENTFLELDSTYTFTHGWIKIVGKVKINGSGHKFRFASQSLSIADGSELVIGPGVEFEFAPTSSLQTAVSFDSDTSKLTLNSSTLTLNSGLGMHLIGGNLCIEGNSIIDNVSTDTHKALILGTNMTGTQVTGEGDCKLSIKAGARLTVKKAGVIFNNNRADSFDAANGKGTLVVEPTSNFIFNSIVDLNNSGLTLDFFKLSSYNFLGDITEIRTDAVDSISTSPPSYVDFSPDGQYLAVGWYSFVSETLQVYRFDGSTLTKVAGISYAAGAYSVNFSPDGKYVAVSWQSMGPEELQIYRFNGSSLVKVANIADSGHAYEVNFSSDGKYVAVGWANTVVEELRVYRFNGSSLVKVASLASVNSAVAVNFSPNGKYVAVGWFGGSGDEVEVYRFNGSSLTKVVGLNNTKGANSVKFSPNGKYLAVGWFSNVVEELQVYSFDGLNLTRIDGVSGTTITSINFSQDGKYLVAGWGNGVAEELQVYRFNGFSLTRIAGIGNTRTAETVDISPNGKYLAVGWYSAPAGSLDIYAFNFEEGGKLINFKDANLKISQDLTLQDIELKVS